MRLKNKFVFVNVNMLNVVMLNVIMMGVMAPFFPSIFNGNQDEGFAQIVTV